MNAQVAFSENTPSETTWLDFAADTLIRVYVPEADTLSYQDALSLALERDQQAAAALEGDFTQLDMQAAAVVAYKQR